MRAVFVCVLVCDLSLNTKIIIICSQSLDVFYSTFETQEVEVNHSLENMITIKNKVLNYHGSIISTSCSAIGLYVSGHFLGNLGSSTVETSTFSNNWSVLLL